uniref:Enoyl-[acyl-carrier-protein] reductase, mitochondrial n=1 Tax=Sipha flava TaxID=143950 RepID=A0A2S2QH92_9HEMI
MLSYAIVWSQTIVCDMVIIRTAGERLLWNISRSVFEYCPFAMFRNVCYRLIGRLSVSRPFTMNQRHEIHCRKIVFNEFGDPTKVARLVECSLPDRPDDQQVLVKMLLAPVNPSDINTIQGMYPVKPPLPSTPGFEGIGEVLAVGSAVKNLVPGDRVVHTGAIGTWCTAGIFDSKKLRKVSGIHC